MAIYYKSEPGKLRGINDKHKRARDESKDPLRSKYHSSKWVKLRQEIKDYYTYDLYAKAVHDRLLPVQCVHHIEPPNRLNADELFFSWDNLIPLSAFSHKEIHELYKTDKRAETIELLKKLVKEANESHWDYL